MSWAEIFAMAWCSSGQQAHALRRSNPPFSPKKINKKKENPL